MANATNSDKTGVSCYDGSGTFNGRTITAGTGVSVSNGDGVSGNPTISADAIVATTYTGDSGSATPAANNLNVFGGTGIDTSGSGDTLTITGSDAVPLTFTADSGSATPASNNLNIVGSGGITTSGTGSTITVDGSSFGTGGWVLLDTQTASNTDYLVFTSDIDSTYDTYVFVITDLIPTSAATTIRAALQTSPDNGSSWNTGGTDYRTSSTLGTQYTYLGSQFLQICGLIWIFGPARTSISHLFRNETTYIAGGSVPTNSSTPGSEVTGTAYNAVRFFFYNASGGAVINTSSGTIRMYGINQA